MFQISAKEEDTKAQPPLEKMTAKAEINIMPTGTGNTIESSPKTLGVRKNEIIFYYNYIAKCYFLSDHRKY